MSSKFEPELQAFVAAQERELWSTFFTFMRDNSAATGKELDGCLVTNLMEVLVNLPEPPLEISDMANDVFTHYKEHHPKLWRLWNDNAQLRKSYAQAIILRAFAEFEKDRDVPDKYPPNTESDAEYIAADNSLWRYFAENLSEPNRVFLDDPVWKRFIELFVDAKDISIYEYLHASKTMHNYIETLYKDCEKEVETWSTEEWRKILDNFILASSKVLLMHTLIQAEKKNPFKGMDV